MNDRPRRHCYKLNQTVHALNDDFDTEEIKKLLMAVKEYYKVDYRHCSLTEYYCYKIEETMLYKKRSLLFHDFEAAAEYRDLEKRYREVLEQTEKKGFRYKSKFFSEGNMIVFCFDEDNLKNTSILGLLGDI
jgi:hypothetical protein